MTSKYIFCIGNSSPHALCQRCQPSLSVYHGVYTHASLARRIDYITHKTSSLLTMCSLMYRCQAMMHSATVKARARAVPNSSPSSQSPPLEDPHSLPSQDSRLQTAHTNTHQHRRITMANQHRQPRTFTPIAPPSPTLRPPAHRAAAPGMPITRQSNKPKWSGSGSSNKAKMTKKLRHASSGCVPNSSTSSNRGCVFNSSSSSPIVLLL